jgi:hypothetical protein
MRAFQLLISGTVGLAALGACGGDGDSGGGPGGSTSGFTAKIDGVNWEADEISIAASTVPGVPGALLVTGTESNGGTSTSLVITLYNVDGPGTYALGVSSDVFGGTGQVGEAGNSWITENTGDEGTITLTTLGGGRIVGTFSYRADPGQNNAVGGTRVVTAGKIDLPFTGTITPLPDNQGSKVSALFGGQLYNAWSAYGLLQDHLGGAGFQFSTSTKLNGLSLLLSGVTAPGTYTISHTNPVRSVGAGRNGGDADHCCWGGGGSALDVGTITITSITATRVQGTITATLQPSPGKPATAPLVITNGMFDIGIP